MAKRKKQHSQRAPGKTTARDWLPDKHTVIEEKTLISPKGAQYRILTTTETDPYDPPQTGKGKKGRTK